MEMAKTLALLLLFLQLSSFSSFAEELESLPPSYPPHTPAPLQPPPVNVPRHHHHHNHSHSPAHTPVHTPYPPHSPPPVHTPYPPHSPPPLHPPTKSPAHPPAQPPTHGHHHHHHHAPAPAPAHTPVVPTHPPLYPPAHSHSPSHPPPPPAHSPSHPPPPAHSPLYPPPAHSPPHPTPIPRSFIAVQGVVYVKSCKYPGAETLLGATSLLGAVVKLQCNNTKYKLVLKDETDKNGYFYIEGPKSITSYAAHKCNVVLVSAPNGLKPSNLHGGVSGAVLRAEKAFVSKGLPFVLYTVGPLAFEPKC